MTKELAEWLFEEDMTLIFYTETVMAGEGNGV